MKKVILPFIIIASLWFLFVYVYIQTPSDSEETIHSADTALTITEPVVIPPASPSIKWDFKTNDDDLSPKTSVSLFVDEKSYEIGTYSGYCTEIVNTEGALLPNEKSAVLCWWAGSGDEIGVFEENGKLVVKAGLQEEGDSDYAGFRGDFTTLFEIN